MARAGNRAAPALQREQKRPWPAQLADLLIHRFYGRGAADTAATQARDFGAPPPPQARLVLLFAPTGGGQPLRREVWLSATAADAQSATEWEELAVGLELPAAGRVTGYD
jgi:hypothetical protein